VLISNDFSFIVTKHTIMRSYTMTRITRWLALLSLIGYSALMAVGMNATSAQGTGLGDLGLPELNVNVTATNFEDIADEIEAGRYLVTVTVAEDVEDGGGVAFVQPEGMSAAEFLEAAAGPPEDVAGEAPDGTPVIEGEAAEGGEGDAPPEFYYQFAFAGGVYTNAGETAQVVLDLTPGEWIAWGDDPEAPQEPVIFNVTGEMPADLAEPESGATLTMGEYVIEVSAGELTAGEQVVKIENIGAQPHFVFFTKGPDGMTEADVQEVLDGFMTGTPSAIDPEVDFVDIAGTGTQSNGTSIWLSLDLEPGTYAMLCFFPDISDGAPHVFHGMYSVVEVGE
jgi:hypothetical protein